jgi:hypothetical protein
MYKPLWMFQKLLRAKTLAEIIQLKAECYPHMEEEDKLYLDRMPDNQQYPAARCAMAETVIMYGRSSSQCVESMNAANRAMRERTSVCVTNAVMLLMKLESTRYEEMRVAAWRHDGVLTPRGRQLCDDAAKEVPRPRDYIYTMIEHEHTREFKIKGNNLLSRTHRVIINKETSRGQFAADCDCGVPRMNGMPCRHIVAIAKSTNIEGLNMVSVMPYWWTTECWRRQFPAETSIACNIDIGYLQEKYTADESIHYCPDFAATRKKGRPQAKQQRCKSPLEMAIEKSKGGKKKRKTVMSEIDLSGKCSANGEEGSV